MIQRKLGLMDAAYDLVERKLGILSDKLPLLAFVTPALERGAVVSCIDTLAAVKYFSRQMAALISLPPRQLLQPRLEIEPSRLEKTPISYSPCHYLQSCRTTASFEDNLDDAHILPTNLQSYDFVFVYTFLSRDFRSPSLRARMCDYMESRYGKSPDVIVGVMDDRISEVPDPFPFRLDDMVVDLSHTSDRFYPRRDPK